MPKKKKETMDVIASQRVVFARRLRLAAGKRNLRNKDIVKLSEDLGKPMSASTVSQYFSGKYSPTHERVALWSSILQVNPYWLEGYGPDDKVIDRITIEYEENLLKEMQDLFMELDLDDQVLIIKVAKSFLSYKYPKIINNTDDRDSWLLHKK